MLQQSSELSNHLMQNPDVCCFACEADGTVCNIGIGLRSRFPYAFPIGEKLTLHFDGVDFFPELERGLKQDGFFITPSFRLYGQEFFLFCLPIAAKNGSLKGILCKLEQPVSPKSTDETLHYEQLLLNANTQLAAEITLLSRQPVSPRICLEIAAHSQAILRNNTLLSVYQSIGSIGAKEQLIDLTLLLRMISRQISAALSPQKSQFQICSKLTRRFVYLDELHFLEALISLLSLHLMRQSPASLELQVSEEGSKIVFSISSQLTNLYLAKEQRDAIAMLQEYIRTYAQYYNGSAAFLQADSTYTTRYSLQLATSDTAPYTSARFEKYDQRLAPIAKLLPLIQFPQYNQLTD